MNGNLRGKDEMQGQMAEHDYSKRECLFRSIYCARHGKSESPKKYSGDLQLGSWALYSEDLYLFN